MFLCIKKQHIYILLFSMFQFTLCIHVHCHKYRSRIILLCHLTGQTRYVFAFFPGTEELAISSVSRTRAFRTVVMFSGHLLDVYCSHVTVVKTPKEGVNLQVLNNAP